MQHDLSKLFTKIDIIVRNERIRYQYKYLHNCLGLTPFEARQELINTTYTTWDGKKYLLGEKSIQRIIHDLQIDCGELSYEDSSNRPGNG